MFTHSFNPVILRAYDIRGIVGESLHEADAYALGRVFPVLVAKTLSKEQTSLRVAIARDGRLSSPALSAQLAKGLSDAGVKVVDVGLGPTPMLYYAALKQQVDGGIMLTGSHNPPSHNGFKMVCGGQALFGDQIQQLGVLAQQGVADVSAGTVTQHSVFDAYVQELVAAYKPHSRPLTIAWDAGNGATGEVVQALVKQLPGKHIVLNEVIDGTFPAHHPDPSEEKNLAQLKEAVLKHNCDLGLAFDGDGDRVGVVDEKGRMIWVDQMMMLFAADVLRNKPGATIIADVKTSQLVFDEVARLGGIPLMWKTGHSFIKAKMLETGAAFAGEMSGHIFFKDTYYGFDDGLYAALRMVNIAAEAKQPLSILVDGLPKAVSTHEMKIETTEEKKFRTITRMQELLTQDGVSFNGIDGVRVMQPEGWWLLRASNTQAVLVARCEARDAAGLSKMEAMLQDYLVRVS